MDNTDVTDISRSGGRAGPVLTVEAARGGGVGPLSLILGPGERLALLGPAGGAADRLCAWLAGADAPEQGRILGRKGAVRPGAPARMQSAGLWAVGPLAAPQGRLGRLLGGKAGAPDDDATVICVADEAGAWADHRGAVVMLCRSFETAAACPRIAIFDSRRKLAEDTPAALRAEYGEGA